MARSRAISESEIDEYDRVNESDAAAVRASIAASSVGLHLDCRAPHNHDHLHGHGHYHDHPTPSALAHEFDHVLHPHLHDHGHAASGAHAADHAHGNEPEVERDPSEMGIIVSGGNFHGEYVFVFVF